MNTTIALYGSIWIVGEQQRAHGELYLKTPMSFIINRDQMMMGKLPGDPERIHLGAATLYYECRDEQINSLYLKATTGIETPPMVLVK